MAAPLIFMNEELQDLYPFENYATFDKVRRLRWCNNTILHAIEYYRVIYSTKTDYDILIKELQAGNLRAIISLLYGAARAANEKIDIMLFGRIYKNEHLKEYIDAVIAGMAAYLPEPEVADHGQNLDEDWPDTQAEVKKKISLKKQTGDSGAGLLGQRVASRMLNLVKQLSGH